jgi:hypothetical protein
MVAANDPMSAETDRPAKHPLADVLCACNRKLAGGRPSRARALSGWPALAQARTGLFARACPAGEGRPPVPQRVKFRAERRRHFRFRMRAPATFTWEKSGSGLSKGEGITRDVSVKGAYVYSETCPPVNAVVHMEILLPSFSRAAKVAIGAKMRTRRVERPLPGKRKRGFSVVSTGKGFVSQRNPQLPTRAGKPRRS